MPNFSGLFKLVLNKKAPSFAKKLFFSIIIKIITNYLYPALYLYSLRAAELEQNKLQEITYKKTGQNYRHRDVIIGVNSHINCFRGKHYKTYEFDSVTYISIQLNYFIQCISLQNK